MLLLLSACVCLLLCAQFYWKRRRLHTFSWKIPGPTGLPLLGCGHWFLSSDASAVIQRFLKVFDDYPGLCKLWLCHYLYYMISKPEYLQIILNSPAAFGKVELYEFVKPGFGNGLISGPVKTWKRHRKIIAPTLNQKILNGYVEKINQQCQILVEVLEKECRKGEINQCIYITNCIMDILGETIFGVPINAQTNDINYSSLIDISSEKIYTRIFRLWYHSDFIFHRTKEFQELNNISIFFKNMTRTIINKRTEQLKCQVDMEDEKEKPFLDLLVEKFMSNEFSQEELEDEVMTFLLAGTETNSTSISFALLLLGMHQDIQQKLYEEVIDVLGPDRMITVDDLSKLKYAECVIREVLRIFPSVPFVARTVEEDIDLGDVVIPKGANVCAGFLHIHRSEKYWPEPLKFDPDRFLPERSLNRHPYTWLPFSGGPRNCIGLKFGMMIIKIVTVLVIRHFRVTSSVRSIQDIPLTASVTLKPKDGFSLALEPRQKAM